eukprot:GHVR01132461.1.p1 GENE.GHVR01132461.1~~GHVR01132461.1.p1  ORF type:complete len:146 (+),score=21.72 GHVR01132461.1:527-964(+)
MDVKDATVWHPEFATPMDTAITLHTPTMVLSVPFYLINKRNLGHLVYDIAGVLIFNRFTKFSHHSHESPQGGSTDLMSSKVALNLITELTNTDNSTKTFVEQFIKSKCVEGDRTAVNVAADRLRWLLLGSRTMHLSHGCDADSER